MGCVAVGFDGGEPYGAVRVGDVVRCGDGNCAGGDGGGVYGVDVVYFEGDIYIWSLA